MAKKKAPAPTTEPNAALNQAPSPTTPKTKAPDFLEIAQGLGFPPEVAQSLLQALDVRIGAVLQAQQKPFAEAVAARVRVALGQASPAPESTPAPATGSADDIPANGHRPIVIDRHQDIHEVMNEDGPGNNTPAPAQAPAPNLARMGQLLGVAQQLTPTLEAVAKIVAAWKGATAAPAGAAGSASSLQALQQVASLSQSLFAVSEQAAAPYLKAIESGAVQERNRLESYRRLTGASPLDERMARASAPASSSDSAASVAKKIVVSEPDDASKPAPTP